MAQQRHAGYRQIGGWRSASEFQQQAGTNPELVQAAVAGNDPAAADWRREPHPAGQSRLAELSGQGNDAAGYQLGSEIAAVEPATARQGLQLVAANPIQQPGNL